MEITPNYAKLRHCIECDFKCCKNVDWERHITTAKHKNRTNLNILEQKNAKKRHSCKYCGKTYNARNSLWYHQKKCVIDNYTEKDEPTDKDLIMMLIKENSELKNMVVDVCQKIQPITNTVNSHNINSNNKTFNLNLFLNETCKDAMNITDFVDSLKLQLSDLENVGKLGYVNGISNIIVKKLNSLDENKRPIHCADKKREVLYVKDQDKWEKENENNNKIRKAIKKIANKNMLLISEFKEKHPDCIKYSSPYSDQYNKIIVESMGGSGDNDLEKENKIIKNIAKVVNIDKNIY
jgi:hypothetical protein